MHQVVNVQSTPLVKWLSFGGKVYSETSVFSKREVFGKYLENTMVDGQTCVKKEVTTLVIV